MAALGVEMARNCSTGQVKQRVITKPEGAGNRKDEKGERKRPELAGRFPSPFCPHQRDTPFLWQPGFVPPYPLA
jgi:hypothetical protein